MDNFEIDDWKFDSRGYFTFLTKAQRKHLEHLADDAMIDGEVHREDSAFLAWLKRWPNQEGNLVTYAISFILHVCYSLI